MKPLEEHLNAKALLDYPFRAGCGRSILFSFGNLDRASTIDQKSQSKAEA
jgi:hypothetical protein